MPRAALLKDPASNEGAIFVCLSCWGNGADEEYIAELKSLIEASGIPKEQLIVAHAQCAEHCPGLFSP
ncbi:MAG TPA: hypothetical protein VMT97_14790 [Terriglobales bacterium]|nr:hypothetical protein [Terriglobales bacterium]